MRKSRDERETGAFIFALGAMCGPLIIMFGLIFLYLALVSPAIEYERSLPAGVSHQYR